jgi:hypothetical protein
VADDGVGIDDPRQLGRGNSKGLAQAGVPRSLRVVRKAAEMQVALVDKGLRRIQAAQPHHGVRCGLNKRGDLREHLGPLVFPPQDLGAVVEAGRAARLANHLAARPVPHHRDVGSTAGVQPRVVGRHVPTVRTDAQDSRHLAVDPHGRNLRGGNVRFRDTRTEALANRLELPLGVFFDAARRRPVQLGLAECGRPRPALAVEQRRLGALRAHVDTEQIGCDHGRSSAVNTTFPAGPTSAV